MDEQGIEERLVANPWIESVRLSRKLPDQLVIDVKERTAAAVVMLSNGTEGWLFGHPTAVGSSPSPSKRVRPRASWRLRATRPTPWPSPWASSM